MEIITIIIVSIISVIIGIPLILMAIVDLAIKLNKKSVAKLLINLNNWRITHGTKSNAKCKMLILQNPTNEKAIKILKENIRVNNFHIKEAKTQNKEFKKWLN